MTNEQMRKIIKYLVEIKFRDMDKAIDLILNEVDDVRRLENLINGLLELGTEQPQIRGL